MTSATSARHRSTDESADEPVPFARARKPLAAPAAAPVAILLALALGGLGGLAIRDSLVEFGVLDGTAYLTQFARWIDGLTAQSWMFWAGIGGVVVGLILLFLALKRRRRLGVPVASEVAMFTRTNDIARLSSDTARSTPGVLDASSSASAKKVTVTVKTTEHDSEELRRQITEAVGERLSALESPPRVTVRATGGDR